MSNPSQCRIQVKSRFEVTFESIISVMSDPSQETSIMSAMTFIKIRYEQRSKSRVPKQDE